MQISCFSIRSCRLKVWTDQWFTMPLNISKTTLVNSSDSLSNSGQSIYSVSYIAGLSSLYSVIIIASLIAYGLIILAVYFNRNLRTICNYFIISLGAADAMIVTTIIPVYVSILRGTFYYYSVAHCEFISTINLVSVSAVSLNLCAVSMERYFAIAHPFKYEAFTAKKIPALVIVAVWLYALLAAILPLMGWRSQPFQIQGSRCTADNEEAYTLFMTIGSFFIPAVIMCTSNFLVYRIAKQQADRIFRIVPVVGPSANLLRKNYRAAKRISLIVGTYLVCWVPHMVVLVIGLEIGARKLPLEVYPVTVSLQYSCSAVNPCLFVCTNRELRKTLLTLIKAAALGGRGAETKRSSGSETTVMMRKRSAPSTGISQVTDESNNCKRDKTV